MGATIATFQELVMKPIIQEKSIELINAETVPNADIPPDVPVFTVLRLKISYGSFDDIQPTSEAIESINEFV